MKSMQWIRGALGPLYALGRDESGNVVLIAAASVIPLLALVGGGLDLSRAYMARTQLQAACDAGVLAGRRAMSTSGDYGDSEKTKAKKLFDYNFDAKTVNATGIDFSTDANTNGQVYGTAKATIPTVVMRAFSFNTFNLQADCMAELQMSNADIMFVLDTTGSMGGTRIAGLREAVKDFHRTINAAVTDDRTRIRYGFVPYSMTVNAKNLFTEVDSPLPRSYFVDIAPYQSREAQFNTPIHVGTTSDLGSTYETYPSSIDNNDCDDYANNAFPKKGKNPITSGSAPGAVTKTTYSLHSWSGSGKKRICTRKVTTSETTYKTKFAFTNWRYKEVDLDTSLFKTGDSVAVGTGIDQPSGSIVEDTESFTYADQAGYYDMVSMAKKNGSELHNVGLTNMTWNGCIEERDTVDDEDWSPIPDGAYDLDLDLAPNSDATRWRPMWNGVSYYRSHHQHVDDTDDYSNAYYACPSPMMLLREVELSEDPTAVPAWLSTYLTNLTPTGNTYHDIGMIWGGRLSSPRGIFAANVNKDAKPVSRHLIFMSDGQMEPYIWGYNAYGIEVLSNRVAPKNSDTDTVRDRHRARFRAACEEVKSQGTTVWVIAFGTSLNDDMKSCSSDGRAYYASDTAALKNQFKYIASQVANLRLGL